METRLEKLIVSRAGGTAGSGSVTYKISLPSTWVSSMHLDPENRRVVLSFNGTAITIRPEMTLSQFKAARLAEGHDLLNVRYFDGQDLCTAICVDLTARDLQIENHTDRLIKTAFGKNNSPSWSDWEAFLEERCIPRQRAGLREFLEQLGLDEYDPLAIVKKTKGRMAEDDQWMEVQPIK